MKRRHFLATAAALPLAIVSTAVRAEEPPKLSADQVLALVRNSYALQDHRMTGRLRSEPEDGGPEIKEPLELTLTQSVMRFRFLNQPPEIVHLDLTTTPATLWQVKAGGSSKVPMKNSADPVRGMDFNYEDLSQRFLYWKNPVMLDENVRLNKGTTKCWLIRVTAPDRVGPYYTVDLWVHKDSGGVAKMEAYNAASKMVKRFQVVSVHRDGKTSSLKEMKVESFNPLSGKVKGRTYMTMDKPVKQ